MTRIEPLHEAKQFLLDNCPAGDSVSVLAAVSGGLDSMCLLHLLHTWGGGVGFAVTAAHFHHGLRGETADRDEAFVRTYCEHNGIPFAAARGDTRALAAREGLTIEESARRLRYAFLEQTAVDRGCTCILTAHHADDNAETMLLNLLRGTGSRGLAGIPPVSGRIYRPFLTLNRAVLEAYAAEHGVSHVEDETNALDDAARNILRHRVLPVLRELNPRAVEHMGRTAAILARENEALDDSAFALTKRAVETARGRSLPCVALRGVSQAVAERAVLILLAQVSGHRKDWNAAHVTSVLDLTLRCGDGEASLPYGLRGRREGTWLLLERGPERASEVPLVIGGETVWGASVVRCEKKVMQGLPKAPAVLLNWVSIDGPLTVGPWRPGDWVTLDRGRRSLKRLFADGHVSPARRDAMPVIYVGGHLAAVPGLAVDAAFAPRMGGEVLEITARSGAE